MADQRKGPEDLQTFTELLSTSAQALNNSYHECNNSQLDLEHQENNVNVLDDSNYSNENSTHFDLFKKNGVTQQYIGLLTDDDIRRMVDSECGKTNMGLEIQLRLVRDQYKGKHKMSTPARKASEDEEVVVSPPEKKLKSLETNETLGFSPTHRVTHPTSAQIQSFIQQLNLNHMTVLSHQFTNGELCQLLQTDKRFDNKSRTHLTRAYVRYTLRAYANFFGDCHIPGDVMTAVANAASKAFPIQLADSDCDLERPTYNEFFTRHPLSGKLRECFKNANRDLPPEMRIRKSSCAKSTPTSQVESSDFNESVDELKLALPERKKEIMVETFEERRRWILSKDGPTITEVMTKFPNFVDPEEITREFHRIDKRFSAAEGIHTLKRLLAADATDDFVSLDKLIMRSGLKSRLRVLSKCMLKKPPGQVDEMANGGVIGCVFEAKSFICIYGGYSFECHGLAEMLSYLVQLTYILNLEYPGQAKSFLKFVAHLHGAKSTLTLTQKVLLI